MAEAAAFGADPTPDSLEYRPRLMPMTRQRLLHRYDSLEIECVFEDHGNDIGDHAKIHDKDDGRYNDIGHTHEGHKDAGRFFDSFGTPMTQAPHKMARMAPMMAGVTLGS